MWMITLFIYFINNKLCNCIVFIDSLYSPRETIVLMQNMIKAKCRYLNKLKNNSNKHLIQYIAHKWVSNQRISSCMTAHIQLTK